MQQSCVTQLVCGFERTSMFYVKGMKPTNLAEAPQDIIEDKNVENLKYCNIKKLQNAK